PPPTRVGAGAVPGISHELSGGGGGGAGGPGMKDGDAGETARPAALFFNPTRPHTQRLLSSLLLLTPPTRRVCRARSSSTPPAPSFVDPGTHAVKLVLFLAALIAAPTAWAAHAYAQFGDIKYPKGFAHFEWVNPDAPKGGEISLVPPLRITNIDKLNPFTLKG